MQYIYNKESFCEVVNFKNSLRTHFIHIKCWDEVFMKEFIVDYVPCFLICSLLSLK